MHVAIVCPYSFAAPGGVQEHARGLARALRGTGHQVTLFAPELKGIPGVATVSLGRSVRVPANGSMAPIAIDPRMLVRFDLGLDPADIVHIHEPFLPAGLAAALRAPHGTPLVGTFHASAARSAPYAVARPLLRRAARKLSATTAVSPAARELVTRYVDVEPLIVPNGIDARAFVSAEPDAWMRELGTTVLFVGRPEPRKGFDVLMRTFAAVAARRPGVHLVCTCPPGSARVLAEGVAERVHCLGPVTGVRKLELFRAADVACVPSLGGESFGVVVLEGLAAGCAVLASDIPGYRYAGAEAAEYVRAGDVTAWRTALERALDDADYRRELAARGPARAAEFDWSVVGAQTTKVYEQALLL